MAGDLFAPAVNVVHSIVKVGSLFYSIVEFRFEYEKISYYVPCHNKPFFVLWWDIIHNPDQSVIICVHTGVVLKMLCM